MSNIMAQNLRFRLVFCWLAVLKTAQHNLLLATFEGILENIYMAKKSLWSFKFALKSEFL
jgi:hypothetical protein